MLRLLGCGVFLLLLAGCGPALSKQELGTVVFEIPKVAGADEPYQLPQSNAPVEQKTESTEPE